MGVQLIVLAARAAPLPRREISTETTDGLYGRLDGDLTLAGGAEYLYSPVHARSTLGAVASLSFYQVATLRIGLEQSLSTTAGDLARAATARIAISPLFLLRFRDNAATESAFFDLTLDSLNVFVGPVFGEPTGANFGSSVSLDAGIGFGLPLMNHASGLWLRPLTFYRSGPFGDDFVLGVTLEYQTVMNSGLLPSAP